MMRRGNFGHFDDLRDMVHNLLDIYYIIMIRVNNNLRDVCYKNLRDIYYNNSTICVFELYHNRPNKNHGESEQCQVRSQVSPNHKYPRPPILHALAARVLGLR